MLAEIIHPNWHVLILHFPLALLILGVLMEVFSRAQGSARVAGRWMIFWGALLAIPTALTGMFAFREVVASQSPNLEHHWYQVVAASSWTDAQWNDLRWHIWLNAFGGGLALAVVFVWLVASERGRQSLRIPGVIALLCSVGMLAAGSWHAGEAIYTTGVGVQPTPGGAPVALDTSVLQLHIAVAGVLFALMLFALARTLHWRHATVRTAEGLEMPADPALRRWWTLTAVVLVLTALGGFYVATGAYTAQAAGHWWNELGKSSRMLAHAAIPAGLLLLALAGVLMPRTIARRTGLSAIFATLMILGIGGQIWMGTLLLYDTDEGSLIAFAEPGAASPAEHGERGEASEGNEGSKQGDQTPAPAPPGGAQPADASGHRGSSASEASAKSSDATTPAASIDMTQDKRFEPAEVHVKVGDVVEWRNVGERTHTVTAVEGEADDASHVHVPDGAEPFDSGEIGPGESWTHRFTVPGRYDYVCSWHEKSGMMGTVIVEPKSAH